MKLQLRTVLVFLLLALPFARAWADEYSDTIKVFKDAGESGTFFAKSYGYAVFPSIGKGGIGIGGAYGKGRVYAKGAYVGDTSVTQLSVGFQLGGQVYSQIIFFEDKRAFDEFTSGNFEFGAQATAVAITAGAEVASGTGSAPAPTAAASGSADQATGTGAALDASVAITGPAGVATGAGQAPDAVGQTSRDAPAGLASGTGAALDASVAVGAPAEAASGTGAALDAEAFIPPPVPPPRWAEGALAGTALVEGAASGTAQVEGILVGAGVIEGGGSV